MTPEEKARVKIDQMFEDAGWLVVDRDFYSPTEKEFDRPSTAQDDDMVKVQANIAELTDRQRKIYELIKSSMVNGTINSTVNAQNISVVLGISLRTTKRGLYVLLDTYLILFVGSDKTGHWEAKQKEPFEQ